jgi:hypothetical protein
MLGDNFLMFDFVRKEVKMSEEVIPIKMTKKHIIKNAKNNNMDFEEAVCEFLDNSIDAKASQVYIKKQKSNVNNLYHFTFTDNGFGMTYESLKSAIGSYGSKGKYDNQSIGMYGVGLKDAVANLCQKGTVKITTIHNNLLSEATMSFDDDDLDGDASWKLKSPVRTNKKNGTIIYIPFVESTTSKTPLLNFLSTTYYPKYEKDNNFKIIFEDHNENVQNIKFEDPLYFNLMKQAGHEPLTRSIKIGNETVQIIGFMYPEGCPKVEDLIMFDSEVGRGTPGVRNARRCGTFWNIGNRFSSLGNGTWHFFLSDQQSLNSCRVCVIVPKSIQNKFVQINKSKININEDDKDLKEFVFQYKEVVTALKKEYLEREKVNNDSEGMTSLINDKLKKMQKDMPNELKSQELRPHIPQSSTEPKEHLGGTCPRPVGLSYEKRMPFKYESKIFDNDRVFLRYEQEPDGRIVITMNENHNYFKKYFIKLNLDEQAIQVFNFYMQIVTLTRLSSDDFIKHGGVDEFWDIYAKKLNAFYENLA